MSLQKSLSVLWIKQCVVYEFTLISSGVTDSLTHRHTHTHTKNNKKKYKLQNTPWIPTLWSRCIKTMHSHISAAFWGLKYKRLFTLLSCFRKWCYLSQSLTWCKTLWKEYLNDTIFAKLCDQLCLPKMQCLAPSLLQAWLYYANNFLKCPLIGHGNSFCQKSSECDRRSVTQDIISRLCEWFTCMFSFPFLLSRNG